MPKYDYECNECNNVIQITRSMKDQEEQYYCPNCKGLLERIWHSPGAIFKGGGFYSTDKNG